MEGLFTLIVFQDLDSRYCKPETPFSFCYICAPPRTKFHYLTRLGCFVAGYRVTCEYVVPHSVCSLVEVAADLVSLAPNYKLLRQCKCIHHEYGSWICCY